MILNSYNIEIFDGSEDSLMAFLYHFHQDNIDLVVKLDDFNSNNFRDLADIFNSSEKQQIYTAFGIKTIDLGFALVYKDSNDLTVYYIKIENEKEKFYILFSFGEFQPTRYKIYLLGTIKIAP